MGGKAPKSVGEGVGTVPAWGGVSHDAPQDLFITVWHWHCLHLGTVYHSQPGQPWKLGCFISGLLCYCCLSAPTPAVEDERTQAQDPSQLTISYQNDGSGCLRSAPKKDVFLHLKFVCQCKSLGLQHNRTLSFIILPAIFYCSWSNLISRMFVAHGQFTQYKTGLNFLSLIFDVHTNRCCLCSCTHTLQACNLKCDVIRTSLMPLDCESTALTLWEWHILSDVDVPVSAEIKFWIEGEKRLKTASGMWHQIISQRRLEH